MNKFLVFLLFYLLWEVILSFPFMINIIHRRYGIDWWARPEFRPLSFAIIYLGIPFILGCLGSKGGNTKSSAMMMMDLYENYPNFTIAISFVVWMFLCERIAYWFLEYKLVKNKLKKSINLEYVELQANNHNANAQKELGMYYMQMHYVNMKNLFNLEDRSNSEYSKAIAWLEKATVHGDKEAKRIVSLKDQLYDEITLDESLEDTMNRLEGKDKIDTKDKIKQRFAEWRKSGLRQYICIRCVSVLLYLVVLLFISITFGVSPFN